MIMHTILVHCHMKVEDVMVTDNQQWIYGWQATYMLCSNKHLISIFS